MAVISTRKQLIHELAVRAANENLGLFVGTGFSMSMNNKMCNFKELVETLYNCGGSRNFENDIKNNPKKFIGKSFPQVVESIEQDLGKNGRTTVVNVVVGKCSINADDKWNDNSDKKEFERRKSQKSNLSLVKDAFAIIKPQWAITTNYDLILEQLLENPETIGPKSPFSIHKGIVPVFHMHGHVKDPENIVISEKDYAQAMKINDYRQLKLSMILAESSVLFIGYSLGDINVRTAIEQSKTFCVNSDNDLKEQNDKIMVLLDFDGNTKDLDEDDVQFDEKMNIYTLKYRSVPFFLSQLAEEVSRVKDSMKSELESILHKIDEMENSDVRLKDLNIELKKLSSDVLYVISKNLIDYLENIWNQKYLGNGEILKYERFVRFVSKLLCCNDILFLNPLLFYNILGRLDKMLKRSNDFKEAVMFWNSHRKDIPQSVMQEMIKNSAANEYYNLTQNIKYFMEKGK
ncbi:SIR2 family NAD-dependent protein deacylase [Fibrobacter sp.]|uniref:SIR2 family NAD-dependent protein deacylase n=1 Tax=Fibrobacter sp. TaxID=35828 RepID=UPI003863273E